MSLRLRIENETSLPDGGPLEIAISGRRGIDIGRDPHLDWTLPDHSRQISGKHCEVRFVEGEYLIYDVSTNGTFVNGSDRRMHGPHALKNGDRILVGNYIILAELGPSLAPQQQRGAPEPDRASYENLWSSESAAPPAAKSDVTPPLEARYQQSDFLDWAAELPSFEPGAAAGASEAQREAERRSVWVDAEPTGAWALAAPKPARPPAFAPTEPDAAQPAPSLPSGPSLSSGTSLQSKPGLPRADDPWPEPSLVAVERLSVEAPVEPPYVAPAPRTPAAPEPPAAVPLPDPAIAAPGEMTAAQAIARFARAAGVPSDTLLRRDAGVVMDELGATTRVAVESMMKLLAARSSTKRSIRSGEYTTIGANDNNPLKFAPSAEDAIAILFGPPMRSYLTGSAALSKGFEDIAGHQLRVFAAMQQALKMLLADLDPAKLEGSAPGAKGVAGLFGAHKARLWDQYVALWSGKAGTSEGGLADVFMEYFSKCYDQLGSSGGR